MFVSMWRRTKQLSQALLKEYEEMMENVMSKFRNHAVRSRELVCYPFSNHVQFVAQQHKLTMTQHVRSFSRDTPQTLTAHTNIRVCSVVTLGADDRAVSVWQTKDHGPQLVCSLCASAYFVVNLLQVQGRSHAVCGFPRW